MRKDAGFSLVELLVVVAIIAILAGLIVALAGRTLRKAEETSIVVTRRDDAIGRLADEANIVRPRQSENDPEVIRARCRAAYRQFLATGVGDVIETELLVVVENEEEFRIYFDTLVALDATAPFEGSLEAGIRTEDAFGNEVFFEPYGTYLGPPVPVRWDLISTDLTQTSEGTLGATVLYSDGSSGYVRYPGAYPMVRSVAELTNTYVTALERNGLI